MAKKILAISHFYAIDNRGGGEVMLHNMLRSLVKAGFKVDAVATNTEHGIAKLDGVTVHQGEKYKSLLTKKYDLVFTQFENADWVMEKCQELNIPCVYIIHNDILKTKVILESHNPDLVVFNTNWIKNSFGYKGNSIVIHPPVYAHEHATTRGDEITLVNLLQSKGANAFYNMARQFPRLKFLGVKGGYFKKDQILIDMPNVTIIESTNNMKRDVWSRTKILLMPSTYETYGMVGVEAMASGIPVIANPTSGLKESLSYAGIFPKANTIAAWRAEILRLQNPIYYQQSSALALKRSAEINPDLELELLISEVNKII